MPDSSVRSSFSINTISRMERAISIDSFIA
jgi:hypothetical protein